MSDERHILQCTCDDCLNAGGGLVLRGAGVVRSALMFIGGGWRSKALSRHVARTAA